MRTLAQTFGIGHKLAATNFVLVSVVLAALTIAIALAVSTSIMPLVCWK